MNDHHDRTFNSLCTFQQFDETDESVNSALLKEAVIAYESTTHLWTEEFPTLEECLQAQVSVGECQTAVPTVIFKVLLFWFDCNCALVLQASVDLALQKLIQSH